MDYMRSACTSSFHFFRDAPATETRVRWYRVPKDRPALDRDTVFGSSIWDDTKEPVDLGEIASSRAWWLGGPASLVPGAAPGRCGTASQWADGLSVTDPLPATDPNTGAPLCCGLVAILARGGIAEGAGADQPGANDGMAFALQSQVCYHTWQELPMGLSLGDQNPPPNLARALPLGLDLAAAVVPPKTGAALPAGLALAALIEPANLPALLGLALNLVNVFPAPTTLTAKLPAAHALSAVELIPVPPSGNLPAAHALDGLFAFNGVPPPGVACATAAVLPMPFNGTFHMPVGGNQWFMFTTVDNNQWHVQFSCAIANVFEAKCFVGPCSFEGSTYPFKIPGTSRSPVLFAAGTQIFIRVSPQSRNAFDYGIEIAPGI